MRAWILPWLLAASTGAQAALCTPDSVPAATLLVPYFELCEECPFAERDTRVAVFNLGPAPRLARVTLWTNAAVPVFDFDLYLQGFAQQEFSLDALLRQGTLPVSGRGVSEPGLQAGPEVDFPGCNAGSSPAGGAPVYAPLDAAARTALRDALRGMPADGSGLCSAVDGEPDSITGYLTVDAVDRCDAPRAGEPGFAAALVDANVLGGRAFVTHVVQNFEAAIPAVPIEAAPGGQLDTDHTFYRFDGLGGDRREPLPTAWAAYNYRGGVYSDEARMIVWRGVGTVQAPFACAAGPAWHPLGLDNRLGWGNKGAIAVDDNGRAHRLRAEGQFPLATQLALPQLERTWETPEPGAVYYNLQHAAEGGQAWVGLLKYSGGRHLRFEHAAALDSSCRGAPFANPSPGVAAPLPEVP